MTLTRRGALGLIPVGLGISPFGWFREDKPNPAQMVRDLTVAPRGKRVPAAGFVITRDGMLLASQHFGYASGLSQSERASSIKRRPFDINTPFRAASISKLATAMIAGVLHDEGTLDLDAPIAPYLSDVALRSRKGADITMRQLLSHTAGLSDPNVYWLAHPGRIDEMMHTAFEARHTKGFEYCNFGYGIAATVIELAAERRFDQLFSDIFNPLPMDAGFNWSGVSALQRSRGATLYRETDEGWQVQADGPDVFAADTPAILIEDGADLSTYTLGQNGTLFSPQGGLRAGLTDLALLAQLLTDAPQLTTPVWTLNASGTNGIHDKRYFTQFGTGVHIHPAEESPWPGQTMWGHHGEAYGLYAGAWHLPDLGIAVSYAVTGTPEIPPQRSKAHPALNTVTEPLLAAARATYENKR
ncbi:MAG: serine hydrolase domain-containing protein [Pseudomonadota bacterium]